MTSRIPSLLGLAIFALGAPASLRAQSWNVPTGSLPAGCQHRTFHSAANQTTIGYNVYLPPDYASNPGARYPVVYSLHGMGGNEWSNLGYATALQANIVSRAVNPMIVVFVNGRSNTFYADSKDGSVKCETAIIRELIPHVDSAFRTIPDRWHRAANGVSMGGFGALMLATKHPDLFGHATSVIAALVTWDTLSQQRFDTSIPTRIFGDDRRYFEDNYYPPTFVRRNAGTLKALGSSFRMADNPGDVTMGPLYSYNVSMRNLLKANGIPVEFDSTAGNGHVADFTGPSGVAILKFHSAAFAAPPVAVRELAPARPDGGKRLRLVAGHGVQALWPGASGAAAFHSLTGRALGRGRLDGHALRDGAGAERRLGAGALVATPLR